jgi:hypothetical protein
MSCGGGKEANANAARISEVCALYGVRTAVGRREFHRLVKEARAENPDQSTEAIESQARFRLGQHMEQVAADPGNLTKAGQRGRNVGLKWQQQTIMYEGREWPLSAVRGGKLFHGSSVKLPVGTILEPQEKRNFTQSAKDAVSVTSLARRALYWVKEANPDGPAYLYEIEPLSTIEPWRVGGAGRGDRIELYEARVTSARIVRVITLD